MIIFDSDAFIEYIHIIQDAQLEAKKYCQILISATVKLESMCTKCSVYLVSQSYIRQFILSLYLFILRICKPSFENYFHFLSF